MLSLFAVAILTVVAPSFGAPRSLSSAELNVAVEKVREEIGSLNAQKADLMPALALMKTDMMDEADGEATVQALEDIQTKLEPLLTTLRRLYKAKTRAIIQEHGSFDAHL